MGKTYIFFEPNNNVFSDYIANMYGVIIKNEWQDVVKSYDKIFKENPNCTLQDFLDDNYKDIIFPACDKNKALKCNNNICSIGKYPQLTEYQSKKVKETIRSTGKKIRNNLKPFGKSVVDRIIRHYITKMIEKTGNTYLITPFLDSMKKVAMKEDAEKLVYVSAKQHPCEYSHFRDNLSPEILDECPYY
jgi:phage major head subunit gpT-like protein